MIKVAGRPSGEESRRLPEDVPVQGVPHVHDDTLADILQITHEDEQRHGFSVMLGPPPAWVERCSSSIVDRFAVAGDM